MWKPIISAVDTGNVSGQHNQIGSFLSQEANRLTISLIESMVEGKTFEEGDPLEEELGNPKGIKDIASAICSLTHLNPSTYLA